MRVPIDGVDLNPGDPPCAGESGSSDRPEVSQEEIRPALPLEPKVSFEEFAIQYRRRQHAEAQRRSLEHRLVATKVSICLSARLLRVAAAVQKGLVEAFKHGDKPGFVTIYSAIHDLQEACDSAFRRTLHRQDPLEEPSLSLHSERTRSSGFMHQLSPKARSGLLEILNLVRTDPRFLFDRISSLTPSQLAALTSSVISDTGDSVLSFTASRSRNQPLFSKRNSAHSVPFKDYALAFERTDPLSVLLFNVFAVPLDWDPAEAHLRLDVWSSTCAKLISHGDSRYHPFVGHVLSYWSLCSDWKAKPKLELYLMDVLQKGAFLLENIESPVASSFGVDPPDPLKTDAAEEFFDAAVQTLFEVLDDADAGLPSATLEFGNAILTKIAAPESQDRFLEYIFIQWFFSRFLYNTLTFPEVFSCCFLFFFPYQDTHANRHPSRLKDYCLISTLEKMRERRSSVRLLFGPFGPNRRSSGSCTQRMFLFARKLVDSIPRLTSSAGLSSRQPTRRSESMWRACLLNSPC